MRGFLDAGTGPPTIRRRARSGRAGDCCVRTGLTQARTAELASASPAPVTPARRGASESGGSGRPAGAGVVDCGSRPVVDAGRQHATAFPSRLVLFDSEQYSYSPRTTEQSRASTSSSSSRERQRRTTSERVRLALFARAELRTDRDPQPRARERAQLRLALAVSLTRSVTTPAGNDLLSAPIASARVLEPVASGRVRRA